MSNSRPTPSASGAIPANSATVGVSPASSATSSGPQSDAILSNSATLAASPASQPGAPATANTHLRVIITGATGMVGEGVLHECLRHPAVEAVLVLSRNPLGLTHPKLSEIIHSNFYDLSAIESQLAGYNACFFCLGVSSVGMPADEYYRVTYTLTMHVAETLSRLNPATAPAAPTDRTAPAAPPAPTDRPTPATPAASTDRTASVASPATPIYPAAPIARDASNAPATRAAPANTAASLGSNIPATHAAPVAPSALPARGNMVFSYVSGAGTDSTEKGRSRWALVKGKTENDLMLLPFRRVYAFRPGFIKAMKGLHNTNPLYKYIGWMFPLGRALYPAGFVTLSEVGLSMIHLALHCDGDAIVSGKDIIRYAVAETSAIAAGSAL